MSDLETGSKLRHVSEPEELGHAPAGDPEAEGMRGADDNGGYADGSDTAAETVALTTQEDASETADGMGAFGSDPTLLAAPPVDGGLAAALAPKPERPKMTRMTAGLAAAALLCVGFLGGVLVERHYAGTSSPAASASSTAGSSSGGNTVTGTVTAVNGNTIYVTAPDGTVYTVTATNSTTVSVAQLGGVSDLRPGQSVTIKGTDTGSGTLAASSISASGYGSGGQSSAVPSPGQSAPLNNEPSSGAGLPTSSSYPTNIANPQGTDFPTDSFGQ
jgi:hypothetical protein